MTNNDKMPELKPCPEFQDWANENLHSFMSCSDEVKLLMRDAFVSGWNTRADMTKEPVDVDTQEFIEVRYQYLFTDPMFGCEVWRDRSSEWNGQRPKDSRKIYTHIAKTGETNG